MSARGRLAALGPFVTPSLALLVACGGAATKPIDARPAASSASPALAATPCSTAEGGGPGGVARVELLGHARVPAASYCGALRTRAGQPLDEAEIRRDVRELWASGFVDDVQVTKTPTPAGQVLTFVVRERPRIRALAVRGAEADDAPRVRGLLAQSGDLLDPVGLRAQIAEVRADYERRGHRKVDVDWKITPLAGGEVDVAIEIAPGPKALVSALRVEGVSKAREAELLALVDTGQGKFNAVGAIYREDRLERTLLELNAWYFDHGMIEAQVSLGAATLSPDGAQIALTIAVTEGPVYHLAEVKCRGDLAEGEPRCLELLGVRKGDVFSRAAMLRGIDRVRELQQKKGRGTVITPETTIDQAGHTVKLTLDVSR